MKTGSRGERIFNPLNNEQGTAIITALLFLMLLTFIGIASTRTTITEKSVVRSEAIFQKDFFLAESAAMEGVQRLDNESAAEELLPTIIGTGATNENLINITIENDGIADVFDGVTTGTTFEISETDIDNTTLRAVTLMPISSGSSLALGASRLYTYNSYGYSQAYGGRAMVKVGFKKRF